MAHYAELNQNNEVIQVYYMDNEIIIDEEGNENDELGLIHLRKHHGSDHRWIRTSYRGNFRGNYAEMGFIYREDIDMFISPNPPFPSWILNESTGKWEPPIPKPYLSDEEKLSKEYDWDENLHQSDNSKGWVLIIFDQL